MIRGFSRTKLPPLFNDLPALLPNRVILRSRADYPWLTRSVKPDKTKAMNRLWIISAFYRTDVPLG